MYSNVFRNIRTVFIILFCLLILPQKILAARSVSISGDKSVLNEYEELSVTASVSGFTHGETIYIKGAFFKEGTSNYFGFTKNGTEWIKNGESTINQKQIIPDVWDGVLISKSDYTDSGFIGEGEYLYKVGFYYTTSGGSLSSVHWSSNAIPLHIKPPVPTSTPTPTSAYTPTPTPTLMATPTIKPTATPTKGASTVKTSSPARVVQNVASSSVKNAADITNSPTGEIMGTSVIPTPTVLIEGTTQKTGVPLIGSILFVGIGLALLSVVLVWKKRNAGTPVEPEKN